MGEREKGKMRIQKENQYNLHKREKNNCQARRKMKEKKIDFKDKITRNKAQHPYKNSTQAGLTAEGKLGKNRNQSTRKNKL